MGAFPPIYPGGHGGIIPAKSPTDPATLRSPHLRSTARSPLLAALLCSLWLCAATPATAREVAGVNFAEKATVAGVPLVLNGAGVRHKAIFKVYAIGLYLPQTTTSAEEALSTKTPRRITVVMLRDIDSAELGQLFTRSMQENMDRANASRLLPGIMRMSQVYSDHKKLKAGEGFQFDWIPGTGAVLTINGQSAGEPFREPEFFQMLMRIWLGPHPADWPLKDALLGVPKTP